MIDLQSLILICFMSLVISAPPKERGDQLNRKDQNQTSQSKDLPKEEAEPKKVKPQVDRPVIQPKKQPEIVRRPDHLDAVPLERDGHLNKQFRQEILFGETKTKADGMKQDGHVDKTSKERARQSMEEKEMLLVETFHKADKNTDNFMTASELELWIQETTLKHLDEAIDETKRVMELVDQDGDGYLTWDEYHYHFLVDNRLMEPDKARKHDEGHADLPPEEQEKIETEIEEWHEADQDPKDGQLSQHEFLAFRHPEHSELMLNEMVKDIMRSLDTDNDGRLSEDEFAAVPKGELVDKRWEESEKNYLQQRRKEFKELIDLDGDHYASFKEIVQYTNPRNSQHAKREVRELMELADANQDGKLTLDEVLKQKAAFLGSGLMNAGKKMHDEI